MKICIAIVVSVAFASEDVMLDEGLSLLQMRAQPNKDSQEPKYYLAPAGGDCPPGEDVDFAQCLEAQVKKIIPNNMKNVYVRNQRSGGRLQRGCFLNIDGTMYFSDEPVGGKLGQAGQMKPVCAKNGGGYDAYMAKTGISCTAADCSHNPVDEHLLKWGEGVVVPELQILGVGETCEACGILDYATCSKASDTGVIEALYGIKMKTEVGTWCSGGGPYEPIIPTGCYIQNSPQTPSAAFCPFDTPDGELAGLVSASGVGQGFRNSRPICMKTCTTTTTTAAPPAPPAGDQAAALGDPHLETNTGKQVDYTLEPGL